MGYNVKSVKLKFGVNVNVFGVARYNHTMTSLCYNYKVR